MEQAAYLEETQRNRDDAQRQLQLAETEALGVHQSLEILRQLVRAYDTVLVNVVAAGTLQITMEPALPPDDVAGPENGAHGPEITRVEETGSPSPERRPEFQHVALPEALETLLKRDEFHTVLSVDDFVDAIYDIKNPQQRTAAKRTFNGELSRAVQRGILTRVGRGRYVILDNRPIGVSGGSAIE